MKTLILLRHAKTEPQSLLKSDFNRNLIDKGKSDIVKVALKFTQFNIEPDLILCSSANRTNQTLELFKMATNVKAEVIITETLYHASASEILDVISKYPQYSNILVIGHNFGISVLANTLSSNGSEEMPTSGMHILEFDHTIEPYKGNLIHSIRPKNL